VRSCELREELRRDEHLYFEIVSRLIDRSRLYVSERWEGDARLFYAYYWVKDKQVIAGWNNAPHHRDLPTFPRHAHIQGRVIPWKEADLKEILGYIEERIVKK